MKFVVFLMLACLVSAIYADGSARYTIEAVLRTNVCNGADTPAITPAELTTTEETKRSDLDTQVFTFEADGECHTNLGVTYFELTFNGTWISGTFGTGGCNQGKRSETASVSLDQAALDGSPICKTLFTLYNGYTFESIRLTPRTEQLTTPNSASTIVPSVLVLMAIVGVLLIMF